MELVRELISVSRDPECRFQLDKEIFKGLEGENIQFRWGETRACLSCIGDLLLIMQKD